jgi:hypothetical protein
MPGVERLGETWENGRKERRKEGRENGRQWNAKETSRT